MQTDFNNFLIPIKDRKEYPFGYKKMHVPVDLCKINMVELKTAKIEKLQNENSRFTVFHKQISRM